MGAITQQGDIKIEACEYFKKEDATFYQRFKFEIRTVGESASISVPHTNIFMCGFDASLTEDMARHILCGFMEGYNKGVRDVGHPPAIYKQICKGQFK